MPVGPGRPANISHYPHPQQLLQRGVNGKRGIPMSREDTLATTLVALADTLVDHFDVVDLLTLLVDRSVELLGVSAAGLMLVGTDGILGLAASSDETMRMVELLELQAEQGPCLDCYRSGEQVLNVHLDAVPGRWPTFTPVAIDAGFHTVHALPLRLRGRILGGLNLFSTEPGDLSAADAAAGQALADMATIAILQHRAASEAQLINEQLQHALTSRIIIEQAKGMLAERAGIDMVESFARLRTHARSNNLRLVDVAETFIDGGLVANALAPRHPSTGSDPH